MYSTSLMISRILLCNGMYHNSVRRCLFDNFLSTHPRYFQDFLLLPYMNMKDAKIKLLSIIRCFEFVNHGNYSYYKLFQIHKGWYPYFEINAWPDGRCREGDDRPGVDGDQVNRVMRLYDGQDLELAIKRECELRCVSCV